MRKLYTRWEPLLSAGQKLKNVFTNEEVIAAADGYFALLPKSLFKMEIVGKRSETKYIDLKGTVKKGNFQIKNMAFHQQDEKVLQYAYSTGRRRFVLWNGSIVTTSSLERRDSRLIR